MNKYDVVIIGGGASGIGASIELSKDKNLKILLIEKAEKLGGILNQCIHDGFGLAVFSKTLTGPEYAYKLTELVKQTNVEVILNAHVTRISDNKEITIYVAQTRVEIVSAKTVILTTGSYERSAGSINLPGKRIAGIMSAGQAQLYLNKNGYFFAKKVLIVGSGDIGLIMARRLSLLGLEVVCVAEIMPYSSGLKRNIVQCLDDFNIPLLLNHRVIDVDGESRVNRVIIAEFKDNQMVVGSEKEYQVDGLLLAVGLIPYIPLADKLGLSIAKSRGPLINNNYQTAFPWLFVSGNALHIHDLADEAYLEGREAGAKARLYLQNNLESQKEMKVVAGNNINYVIPNTISFPLSGTEVHLKFRVSSLLTKVQIAVKIGEKIVFKKFYPFINPSELTQIEISSTQLTEGEKLSVEVIS